jgi:hypothetical protein
MKQTRLASLLDTIGGTAVAFFVALGVQWAVAVWFDLPLRMGDNAAIVAIFTAVSLVRGYAWRRLMEAVHVKRQLSPFMQAVIAERFRQVEVEGFSAAHDDALNPGELAEAGAAYADCAACHVVSIGPPPKEPPPGWPWSSAWWKPQNFRRDLVRAGALIIADGERHDRNRKRAK